MRGHADKLGLEAVEPFELEILFGEFALGVGKFVIEPGEFVVEVVLKAACRSLFQRHLFEPGRTRLTCSFWMRIRSSRKSSNSWLDAAPRISRRTSMR